MTSQLKPPPTGGNVNTNTRAGQSGTVNADLDADRRRQALRAFLDKHSLTPADLARAAGLPSANGIYNFLVGRSRSLSQLTIERLAAAIPGTSVQDLIGMPDPTAHPAGRSTGKDRIPVTCIAQAGTWSRSWRRPADQWSEFAVPEAIGSPSDKLFGVLVRSPGAEFLHRDGTVLVCRKHDDTITDLTDGCQVVIRRTRAGLHEMTVREIGRHDDNSWLWPRSTHPEHQQPVLVGEAGQPRSERRRHGSITIIGLVLAAWKVLPSHSN